MNNIEKNDLIYIKHKLRKYYNKLQSNPANKDLYERKIRQYIRIIQEGGVKVSTITGTKQKDGIDISYFEGLKIEGYKLYDKIDETHPITHCNINIYGVVDESTKNIKDIERIKIYNFIKSIFEKKSNDEYYNIISLGLLELKVNYCFNYCSHYYEDYSNSTEDFINVNRPSCRYYNISLPDIIETLDTKYLDEILSKFPKFKHRIINKKGLIFIEEKMKDKLVDVDIKSIYKMKLKEVKSPEIVELITKYDLQNPELKDKLTKEKKLQKMLEQNMTTRDNIFTYDRNVISYQRISYILERYPELKFLILNEDNVIDLISDIKKQFQPAPNIKSKSYTIQLNNASNKYIKTFSKQNDKLYIRIVGFEYSKPGISNLYNSNIYVKIDIFKDINVNNQDFSFIYPQNPELVPKTYIKIRKEKLKLRDFINNYSEYIQFKSVDNFDRPDTMKNQKPNWSFIKKEQPNWSFIKKEFDGKFKPTVIGREAAAEKVAAKAATAAVATAATAVATAVASAAAQPLRPSPPGAANAAAAPTSSSRPSPPRLLSEEAVRAHGPAPLTPPQQAEQLRLAREAKLALQQVNAPPWRRTSNELDLETNRFRATQSSRTGSVSFTPTTKEDLIGKCVNSQDEIYQINGFDREGDTYYARITQISTNIKFSKKDNNLNWTLEYLLGPNIDFHDNCVSNA
jgi:hypothetical protein